MVTLDSLEQLEQLLIDRYKKSKKTIIDLGSNNFYNKHNMYNLMPRRTYRFGDPVLAGQGVPVNYAIGGIVSPDTANLVQITNDYVVPRNYTGETGTLSIGETTMPITNWTITFNPVTSNVEYNQTASDFYQSHYHRTTNECLQQTANDYYQAATNIAALRLSNTFDDSILNSITQAYRQKVIEATKHIEKIKFIADIDFAKKKPRLLLL